MAEPEPSFGRRFFNPSYRTPLAEPSSFRSPLAEPSSFASPEPSFSFTFPDPEPEPEPVRRLGGGFFQPKLNFQQPQATIETTNPLPLSQSISAISSFVPDKPRPVSPAPQPQQQTVIDRKPESRSFEPLPAPQEQSVIQIESRFRSIGDEEINFKAGVIYLFKISVFLKFENLQRKIFYSD